MPERWRLSLTAVAVMAMIAIAMPAVAGVPDIANSFFVPQRGTVGTPIEGTTALPFFRSCPGNDASPGNARVKVVVRDVNGNGISGIAAADICLLFNGGTPSQSFSGVGADSVIANSQFNQSPLCPDVRCVQADDQTDATGTTYITFLGATPGSPGIGTRNPARRWGHYDTEIPVFVLGFKLSGRLTTASANGTYTLRIKSYDMTGGTGPVPVNTGEVVSLADLNSVVGNFGLANILTYWRDFDTDGAVALSDLNQIVGHFGHSCINP